MKRLLSLTLLLTLTVVAASARTNSAAAATHPRAQSGLVATVTAFGYAMMNGPGNRADSFATPALLSHTPARHVINLMGPAQNPPQAFRFQIASSAGNRASISITWKWGANGNVTNTTWVLTSAGWKLDAMHYVRPLATRDSLVTTNYVFMRNLQQGARSLNSFATADFLRHAPGGQLVNLYGFQNPFRSSSLRVNSISSGMARVTQSYNFGSPHNEVRHVTWAYTTSGWKIVGVAGPGRG